VPFKSGPAAADVEGRVILSEAERYTQRVKEMAARACETLFEGYGCPVRTLPAHQVDLTPLALFGVLGFSARALRGQLWLGCSQDLLVASNPSPTVAVREWIGELTNQLLGRIKSQWVLYGVEIQVSTPISFADAVLAGGQTRSLPGLTARGTAGKLVQIWLDLSFGHGFQMSDQPDSTRAGARESDSLLF
jgi:hypothetical protein